MKSIIALAILAALTVGCSKAPTAAATGDQACARDLKRFVSFNNPYSGSVNSIGPNNEQGNYNMSVSAKNAMGGCGAPVMCIFATDRAEVVTITCDVAT